MAYTAPERIDSKQIESLKLFLNNSTNPQMSPTSASNNSTMSKQEPSENSIYSNFMTTESQFGNSYSSKNSISRTNPTKSVIDGTILGIFKERKYWLLSI